MDLRKAEGRHVEPAIHVPAPDVQPRGGRAEPEASPSVRRASTWRRTFIRYRIRAIKPHSAVCPSRAGTIPRAPQERSCHRFWNHATCPKMKNDATPRIGQATRNEP